MERDQGIITPEVWQGTASGQARGVGAWGRLGRQLPSALLHLIAFIATYYTSYWLRFDGQLGEEEIATLLGTVGVVALLKLLIFSGFGLFQGWGRFITFYDLVALVRAATASLVAMVLVNRFLLPVFPIPRSVFLLDWGGTIMAVGGLQAVRRLFRERNWGLFLPSGKVAALIVGADESGESLLRNIIRHGEKTYHVVGFIDDDPRRVGMRIGGVPVLGAIDQACDLAERHRVQELLITTGKLAGTEVRKLVEEAQRRSIGVRVLPSYEQLISGSVAITPRPVCIEDLLRRAPVQLDVEEIRRWIDGRVLLVTGSAGSIGSEICRQLLRFAPKRLVLVDRSESAQFFLERELQELAGQVELDVCLADVMDRRRMHDVLRRCRPDVIFHAAAYKHVPLMESHPGEAVKNTLLATCRMADLASAHRVPSFVLISTDKAINPSSVMGACKRVAEMYLQARSLASPCRFVTVRFGNVLDSAGSVVQIFRQQIARGGPVTVTDPRVERYFMTIPEAASLVIEAGAIGENGSTLMLDMGQSVPIVELAADMIRLSGLEVDKDIRIEFTGLRPGEKLYEDLRGAGEVQRPTRHPKIAAIVSRRCDPALIFSQVERLNRARHESPEVILQLLRQVVPELAGEQHDGHFQYRKAG